MRRLRLSCCTSGAVTYLLRQDVSPKISQGEFEFAVVVIDNNLQSDECILINRPGRVRVR